VTVGIELAVGVTDMLGVAVVSIEGIELMELLPLQIQLKHTESKVGSGKR